MNGGPTRKPIEPIELTAAIDGPGRLHAAGARGAEQQRHAVGDADADQHRARPARRPGCAITSSVPSAIAASAEPPRSSRVGADAAG